MTFSKGSVLTLAAVLCALGVVGAKFTHFCEPPLVGEWTMNHNFPDPETEDGYFLGAQSNWTLTNPQERVYQATGTATSFLPDAPPAPGSMSILAIFDPEDCTLSGAFYLFQLNASDVFEWDVVHGGFMTGEYTAFEDDVLFFPTFGRHDATFVG